MSKIILKSQEQNVNYLKSGEVKSGYVLRPVQYSRIGSKDLVDYCAKNSYVPKAYVGSTITAITEAMENFLLNGHSIELPDFGTFSLSCECTVAPTAETAGMEQFKALKLNFRPSIVLKDRIEAVDLEMEGIYRCLDLKAENKVYEKITQSDSSSTPNGGENQGNGGNNQGGGNGDDLVG